MKKIMVICICVFCMLVSCNSKNSDFNESNNQVYFDTDSIMDEKTNYEKVDSLTILYPTYTKSKLDSSNWENYFESNYDIKIEIEYIDKKGPLYALKNEIPGILYLDFDKGQPYNQDVYSIIQNYELYDISNYYQQYGWDNFIDIGYISPLTKGQEIKAIPVLNEQKVSPRYYNSEYIKALGGDIPVTINEFTSYLNKSKELSPEFYPMYIGEYVMTQSTADIFRAFDVYMNNNAESAITYNPKTNSIEDGVFSDNFKEGLLYIKMLKETNMLKIFKQDAEAFSPISYNKKIATEYNSVYKDGYSSLELIPSYETEKGYYLMGDNKEKLIVIDQDLSYYVFPKAIENIDGTIELFNNIFANSIYYNDLKYGVEGKDYIKDAINNNQFIETISLKQIKPSDYEVSSEMEWLSYDSQLTYEVNSNYNVLALSKIVDTEIYDNFDSFYKQVATPNIVAFYNSLISTEEAISRYKINFQKNGMNELIDAMNEKLGFTTNCFYD